MRPDYDPVEGRILVTIRMKEWKWKRQPRAMEVAGIECEADYDNVEDGIDDGDGGSPSFLMKVVLSMDTIEIEDNMSMEEVGSHLRRRRQIWQELISRLQFL